MRTKTQIVRHPGQSATLLCVDVVDPTRLTMLQGEHFYRWLTFSEEVEIASDASAIARILDQANTDLNIS